MPETYELFKIYPISPVCNHPSESIVSLVFSRS